MKKTLIVAMLFLGVCSAQAQITIQQGPVVLEDGTESALNGWTGVAHQLVHNNEKPNQLRISDGTTVGGNIIGGDIHGPGYVFIPATTNALANGAALLAAIDELNLLGGITPKYIQLDVGVYNLSTNSGVVLNQMTIIGTETGRYKSDYQSLNPVTTEIQFTTNNVGLFSADQEYASTLAHILFTYSDGNITGTSSTGSLFLDSGADNHMYDCQVRVSMATYNGGVRKTKFVGKILFGQTVAPTPTFYNCDFFGPGSFTIESAVGTTYSFYDCYFNVRDMFSSVGTIIVCVLELTRCEFDDSETTAGADWYAGGTVVTKSGFIQYCRRVPAFASGFTTLIGCYNTKGADDTVMADF